MVKNHQPGYFLCFFLWFLSISPVHCTGFGVIIAWTKFLVMFCETWLGNPGSMAGGMKLSFFNGEFSRHSMFDYHEGKQQKDTKKFGRNLWSSVRFGSGIWWPHTYWLVDIMTGWWFQTFIFQNIYRIILPIDFHMFQDC